MKKIGIKRSLSNAVLQPDEVIALEGLLEEVQFRTKFKGKAFNDLDDAILAHGIAVLGIDRIAQMLTGCCLDLGGATRMIKPIPTTLSPRTATGASSPLKEFILGNCRGAFETIQALFQELNWRLEPAVLGGEEIPTSPPSAIQATRLGALDRQIQWQTVRTCADHPLILVSTDSTQHDGAIIVNSELGTKALLGFNVAQLCKGSFSEHWSVFYVSRDLHFQEDPSRELIIVSAKSTDTAPAPPAKLIQQGFLAEAWHKAIEDRFSAAELLALQALIWPKMRKLLEEVEHHDPVVNRDIASCMNTLDGRAHNVRERILKMFDH